MRSACVKADIHGLFYTVQPRDWANRVTWRSSDWFQRAAEHRGGTKFLRLVNFRARFIPNLASIAEPLQRLIRKDTPFVRGVEQQSAFDALKCSLGKAETLAYFDSNAKETKHVTGASPVGLGAYLPRFKERVVAYASCSLTDVERSILKQRKRPSVLFGVVSGFTHTYIELISPC